MRKKSDTAEGTSTESEPADTADLQVDEIVVDDGDTASPSPG
jgi:hypothetical protein